MATLQEVAKKAGVSTATVSKVLSNTPYFTEKTRQKVMAAVDELGYVPNLAARALVSGRTNIIGVVFPFIYDTVFTDPFVMYILEGLESVCRENRFNLLLSTPRLNGAGVEHDYLQLLRSGYLEGIVALDNVPVASVIEPAAQLGVPTVAIGSDDYPHYVYTDDFVGGNLVMEHVLSLGHRHIGIIQSPTELHAPLQRRIDGFRHAATNAGLDFAAFPIADGDFSIDSGVSAASELLIQCPDLTAIVCANDRMAMGAIQYASQHGYSVPERLTVVGYDNIPSSRAFTPPLTTINQHAPELGRHAARILFALLNGEQPDSVVLTPELLVRESSAFVEKGG